MTTIYIQERSSFMEMAKRQTKKATARVPYEGEETDRKGKQIWGKREIKYGGKINSMIRALWRGANHLCPHCGKVVIATERNPSVSCYSTENLKYFYIKYTEWQSIHSSDPHMLKLQ